MRRVTLPIEDDFSLYLVVSRELNKIDRSPNDDQVYTITNEDYVLLVLKYGVGIIRLTEEA